MPSLAVTQPYATRALDLIDATDRSYRQIESAWASAIQIQKALRDLTNIDPKTGLAQPGAYFMPSSISASNRSLYELYIDFLNRRAFDPIAGAGLLKVFTPDASPGWPVNGLVGLYNVLTLAIATYDPNDSTTFAVSMVVSNTADTVTTAASCFLASDLMYLIPNSIPATDVLTLIMNLS